MNTPKMLPANLFAAVLGTAGTLVIGKLLASAWRSVTGEPPPRPGDPDVPLRRALMWTVASGLGVAITQLLINRLIAHRIKERD